MISPECPSLNALMAFLTESQQGHGDSTIEQHLDQCESCLQRLENLYTPITPGSDEFKSAHHSSRQSTTDSGEFFLNRLKSSFPRQLPNKIGSFQVLRLLAEGGTGDVYECRDTRLNRRVAVKTIRPQMLKHRVLERLKQEARIQGTLSHDNIVPLHDFGTNADGIPYLVMEMIDGGTLSDLVREKPLSPTAAARLIATCAHAVHYAHEKGVLHRDLKPSNILIANHRPERQEKISLADRDHLVPKITDFGLAKLFDNDSRRITQSGTVLGTPSYMSPEQAAGGTTHLGPQSDVYALGVILYECITGRPPFFSDNVAITLRMIQENEPTSPRILLPGLSKDLETICLKCLQKNPAQRYETAASLSDDLERYLNGIAIHARPLSTFTKTWRWSQRNPTVAASLLIAFTCMVLTACASITFAYLQATWRQDAEQSRNLARLETARAENSEAQVKKQKKVIEREFFNGIRGSLNLIEKLVQIPDGEYSKARLKTLFDDNCNKMLESSISLYSLIEKDLDQHELAIEVGYFTGVVYLQSGRPIPAREWFNKVVQYALNLPADRKLSNRTLGLIFDASDAMEDYFDFTYPDQPFRKADFVAAILHRWPLDRLSEPANVDIINHRQLMVNRTTEAYKQANRTADAANVQ